jgi:hypothetical protein
MPYLRPYAEWSNLRKPWLLRLLVGGKNVRFLASDTLLRTLHNSLTNKIRKKIWSTDFVELYMRYKLHFLENFKS